MPAISLRERRIIGLAGLAIMVLALLLVFNGRITHRATLRATEVRAQTMALIFERHILQVLAESRSLILTAEVLLQDQQHRPDPARLAQNLDVKLQATEHLTGLAIFDGEGGLLLATGAFPRDDVAFRPRAGGAPPGGVLVQPARLNPETGRMVVSVERRLDGQPGVGVALVDVARIAAMYRDVDLETAAFWGLLGPDQELLLHVGDELADLSLSASDVVAAVGEETPHEGVTPLGPRAFAAFHDLDDPLMRTVVVVDAGPDLLRWRSGVVGWLSGGLLAMLLVVLFTILVVRQVRAERQARESLADLNAHLETLVLQRSRSLQKALETQRQLSAVAEAATHAKSRFLTAVSHDLRQPLQALRLYQQVLGQRLDPGPGTVKLLAQMEDALQVAQQLLDTLLEIGRIEAGLIVPQERPVTFAEVAAALEGQIGNPRLRIVPSSIVLHADPVFLARILGNLVGNALRHAEGAVVTGVRRVPGGGAAILVADRGPGIPADKLDVIFEEFYQLGNAARSREKGLGLGLSIARRLADAAGYGLSVRSSSHGSIFTLTLPAGAVMAWRPQTAAADRTPPTAPAAAPPDQPA